MGLECLKGQEKQYQLEGYGGPGFSMPFTMLVLGLFEGPGKTVPVRGLVLGLFLFQSYRA